MRYGLLAVSNLLLVLPLTILNTPAWPRDKASSVRNDRYGDPLPAGAVARFGTTRLRHDGPPKGLIFHPDGKSLITWSDWDKKIRYWEVSNGKEIKSLNGATYVALGWSKSLVFACAESEGGISVRDHAGKELRQLDAKTDAPRTRLVFSANGTTLASVHDVYVRANLGSYPQIVLWRPATGEFIRRIDAWESMSHPCVLLSPDGGTLAIGGANGRIQLYDVKTGIIRHELEAVESVYHMAYSPDGQTLASCCSRMGFQLWDTRTGKESGTIIRNERDTYFSGSLTFSPDGKLLVVGSLNGIQVWDVTAKKIMCQFPRSSRWDDLFAISPDGKTLASAAYAVLLWDLHSGKDLLHFEEPSARGECLAFSPDGQHLAAGGVDHDYSIGIWNVKSGKKTIIQKHTWTVHDLQFDREAQNLISASADKSIRWWDVKTAKQFRVLEADDQVTSIALSPDFSLLATKGGRNEVLFWNALSGDKLSPLSIGNLHVHRVAFGLGKRLLITTEYNNTTIRLWNIAKGCQSSFLETDKSLGDPLIAVSPDGKTLATADNHAENKGTVRLWELATGRERLRINLNVERYVNGIAFATHGQALAISAGETIYLCGVATGKELSRLCGPASQLCMAFSADNKMLASLSRDTTILVWDVSQLDGEHLGSRRFEKGDLENLQRDFEGEDSEKAHLAINALAAAPERAVALAKSHLQPATAEFEKKVTVLLADLDSEKFAVRDVAFRQLAAMEGLAEPWLRKALAAHPSFSSF